MKNLLISIFILACTTVQAEDYLFNHTNPRGEAYLCRLASADIMTLGQSDYIIADEHNGDDLSVANYAGSFHKILQHDATTGLLTTQGKTSYEQLLLAINSALQADFNAIVRAPEATRKLVSPQAAYTRSLVGVPSCVIPMPSAPTLTSAHAAADMIEVYLKALCRDVEFKDYGTGANSDVDIVNGGSITNNAAAILTALGNAYKGPSHNGMVTAKELFRGTSSGDLVGPYISQFLWLPTYRLFQNVEQKQYVPVAQQREFGVAWSDFISIQNGAVPKPYDIAHDFAGQRYIINGRDVGTAVHNDGPGEFHIHAVDILLYHGAPLSPVFPYKTGAITNEAAFVNMMIADIYSAVFDVAYEALKHSWTHKWRSNRKIRPEGMAGLVHRAKITGNNEFNLHASLFEKLANIDVLAWVKTHNTLQESLANNALPEGQGQTYLLSLMYPEGSPTHPSYPAGHAVIAGACSTIVKAYFDDTALLHTLISPVKPDPNDPTILTALSDDEGTKLLTIGGELDKLASNIAIARNIAGVHYRSDGDEGILLGEQVALCYLQDRARMYTEQGFTGFELTKYNGERVRVTPEAITVIS